MKRVLQVVLVGLMTGCANQQAVVAPQPQVVTVKVAVPVPCKITPVTKPAFAVDSLPLGAQIDEQMRALRAERQQRKGYEERLAAVMQACQ